MGHVCIVHVDRAVADSSSLLFVLTITSMCVMHVDRAVADSSSLLFVLTITSMCVNHVDRAVADSSFLFFFSFFFFPITSMWVTSVSYT